MKTVVLCGSRRFKQEMREFARQLQELGVVVYQPYLHSRHDEWANLSDEYKQYVALGLTHDHFAKIRLADVVFVFNKDGYVGNSTTLEIGYAVGRDKPIYALQTDESEICRQVLFREMLSSPAELVKKLA